MKLKAHTFLQETIELKKTIEVSFLTLGERLSRIRKDALWSSGYDSFEEFLVDAKLSEATASKLINIYEKFHLKWEFPAEKLAGVGGWSIVATLLPVCKTKEEADQWIDKAEVLTRADLEKEVKEFKTGKDMRHCEHKNAYTIRVCRDCGDRFRDYEEEEKNASS